MCDLGYCSVGIDEGWEGCGLGVNHTQHYINGTPAINTALFPNMKGLVAYGHARGLKMGWYVAGTPSYTGVDLVEKYRVNVRVYACLSDHVLHCFQVLQWLWLYRDPPPGRRLGCRLQRRYCGPELAWF